MARLVGVSERRLHHAVLNYDLVSYGLAVKTSTGYLWAAECIDFLIERRQYNGVNFLAQKRAPKSPEYETYY